MRPPAAAPLRLAVVAASIQLSLAGAFAAGSAARTAGPPALEPAQIRSLAVDLGNGLEAISDIALAEPAARLAPSLLSLATSEKAAPGRILAAKVALSAMAYPRSVVASLSGVLPSGKDPGAAAGRKAVDKLAAVAAASGGEDAKRRAVSHALATIRSLDRADGTAGGLIFDGERLAGNLASPELREPARGLSGEERLRALDAIEAYARLQPAGPPKDPLDLSRLLGKRGLGKSPRLKIVPIGAPVPYAVGVLFKNLALDLAEGDDLAALAGRLALGGDAGRVERKLREHLAHGAGPMPLMELLPAFPRKMAGKGVYADGPNCWNATLNFHDPSAGVKFTDSFIMDEELERSYRPLGRGDELRFGDVAAFYEGRHILHTAVYLDDDLFFHKANSFAFSPYAFETWQHVSSPYRFPKVNVKFFRYLRPVKSGGRPPAVPRLWKL